MWLTSLLFELFLVTSLRLLVENRRFIHIKSHIVAKLSSALSSIDPTADKATAAQLEDLNNNNQSSICDSDQSMSASTQQQEPPLAGSCEVAEAKLEAEALADLDDYNWVIDNACTDIVSLQVACLIVATVGPLVPLLCVVLPLCLYARLYVTRAISKSRKKCFATTVASTIVIQTPFAFMKPHIFLGFVCLTLLCPFDLKFNKDVLIAAGALVVAEFIFLLLVHKVVEASDQRVKCAKDEAIHVDESDAEQDEQRSSWAGHLGTGELRLEKNPVASPQQVERFVQKLQRSENNQREHRNAEYFGSIQSKPKKPTSEAPDSDCDASRMMVAKRPSNERHKRVHLTNNQRPLAAVTGMRDVHEQNATQVAIPVDSNATTMARIRRTRQARAKHAKHTRRAREVVRF